MRKIFLAVLMVLFLASSAFATGSCVYNSTVTTGVPQKNQKRMVTLTCTGDGSIAAFSFNPVTYDVKGWYLYTVTTDPGTSAPTDLYDITLVVNGEDVAGGLLADRSTSATQTRIMAYPTIGYPIMNETMAITFANNSANPSTIVLKLNFVEN